MKYSFLTHRERDLIVALAPAILPETPADFALFKRKMLFHIDRFLAHLSPVLKFLFHLGALTFNLMPLFHRLNLRTFRGSTAAARGRYVASVDRSAFSPLYRWFSVTRGLIMLFYYSQDEQLKKINYSPREWAKTKVLDRRRQLNLMEEVAYDPYSTRHSSKLP